MDDVERPLVSVVIPCFNHARFLPSAVASVRAQDYPRIEILVVDDGSTDGTADVAARCGVRVSRQRNGGVSRARNAGLEATAGSLLVFLDADDELLPGSVATGVAALAAHPNAACAAGRCTSIDAQGNPVGQTEAAVDTSDLYRTWLLANFVWAPAAVIFRRQALLAIGGFPIGHEGAADYAVYLRLARQGGAVFHGERVAAYRQHGATMSQQPARMLRDVLAVLAAEETHAPAGYAADFARGRQAWTAWYGEQIVDSLRRDWRDGRHGWTQLSSAALLLRHSPSLAARHLLKRLQR
jgi:glycosyltransferase involved in cell wall biosynthesis